MLSTAPGNDPRAAIRNCQVAAIENLADFIQFYHPQNRFDRKLTWDLDTHRGGHWRQLNYEELAARDKISLDLFWLKDKNLTDLDNLSEPDALAEEIIENLEGV
jgi:type I restriction enzyme M protein